VTRDSDRVEVDGAVDDAVDDSGATGTEVTTSSAEPSVEEADAADATGPAAPRRRRRTLVTAGLLAVLLLASAGVTGWLYLNQYRPDQQTDAAASKVALDAATSGTVALLSYSPDSLDKDFAAAKSRLTGDFLSYYTQFTEQIVTPAAREKSVKTAASVVRAAVSQLQPDTAEVLVFINQTTTSKENPDGAFAASSVKVGMRKVDGTWLIDSFDPV
jgi:Mce-associated membrane protein